MRVRTAILILLLAASMHAVTLYRTPRLATIAAALRLNLPDTVRYNNIVIDSVAICRGKDIHVRTNGLGDITHIGYNLFAPALRQAYKDSPVFDFLERYLLELDLQIDERTQSVRMDVDQVTVVKGNIQMLRTLDPKSDVSFNLDEITRKMYRVTIAFNGKKIQITFPAINELLIGANMLDLEDILKRDVQRMMPISGDALIADWTDCQVSKGKDVLIVEGGNYLSPLIRGDIYLTEQNGIRKLICDSLNPTKSVSNIMLTGMFDKAIPLKMDIDRYGGKADSLEIKLQQFIAYCKSEGCKLFFGIKNVSDDTLTGTFFAYNEKYSYDHMMTVVFPLQILQGKDDAVRGKVYSYIPLHHIAEKYFNINQEPIQY